MLSYTYQPLPTPASLRLLDVEPLLDGAGDIHCSLRAVPMSREYEYCALSYSWGMDDSGDASLSERIIIDGRHLMITRNLFEGLHRIFAGREQKTPIWIDAVCINQQDIPERNSQVARMAQVYSNATQVICWLGNGRSQREADNIAALVVCFNTLPHRTFRQHTLTLSDGSIVDLCLANAARSASRALERNSKKPSPRMPDCIKNLFDARELTLVFTEIQCALRAFLGKRYWGRLWIVQELCHAPDNTYVLWSKHSSKLDAIQHLVDFFLRATLHNASLSFCFMGLDALFEQDCDRARAVMINRVLFRNGDPDILSHCIVSCFLLNCFDPRDRAFALLSLDPAADMHIDYDMTAAQVWTSFSAHCLRSMFPLPSLLAAAAKTASQRTLDDEIAASLPSWALDLRFETLRFERHAAALGEWTVGESGWLTCSAMIVGTIDHDLDSIVPRRIAASHSDSPITAFASAVWPLIYAYDHYPLVYGQEDDHRQKLCAGDLVCIFEDIDHRSFGGRSQVQRMPEVQAIALRPLEVKSAPTSPIGCSGAAGGYAKIAEPRLNACEVAGGHRIVARVRFRPDGWVAGTHVSQTLCIR